VLGLILSGIFLLETYGVVHTSATNAGLIISLTMIFTPLAEAAVTRAPPLARFPRGGRPLRARRRPAHPGRRLHQPSLGDC